MIGPGTRIGRYVVEAEIGRGGMALVYRVRHGALGSEHALKVLRVVSAPLVRRLVLEGKLQARIRHPNVVAVTDIIRVGPSVGLVMDHVPGPTLERWLEGRALEDREIREIFRQIVSGVQAAHASGTVHRDLKPNNVLMLNEDGRWRPRITDFGIAKVLDDGDRGAGMTHTGTQLGTPVYMAPEQFRDARAVDHRADIYSLGCILYRMICGHPPIEETDQYLLVHRALAGEYADPRTLRPDLSPEIFATVQGCLKGDPAARLQSCDEVLTALYGRMPGMRSVVPGTPPPPSPKPAPPPSRMARALESLRERAQAHVLALDVAVGGALEQAGLPPGLVLAAFLGALLLIGVGLGMLLRGPSDPPEPLAGQLEPAEPEPEPELPDPGPLARVSAARNPALTELWLVPLDGGTRLPVQGTVYIPAGDYRIEAGFDGAAVFLAGRMSVEPGELVTIRCNARQVMCRG